MVFFNFDCLWVMSPFLFYNTVSLFDLIVFYDTFSEPLCELTNFYLLTSAESMAEIWPVPYILYVEYMYILTVSDNTFLHSEKVSGEEHDCNTVLVSEVSVT